MKAFCVRRTQRHAGSYALVQTYYRISGGKGLQVQKVGAPKYYRDVIVSTSTVGRPETMLFAANKDGTLKHTSQGHLVTLWGGEVNTTSAHRVLKNAGVEEITTCPDGSGPFDARRRSRRRKRSR